MQPTQSSSISDMIGVMSPDPTTTVAEAVPEAPELVPVTL